MTAPRRSVRVGPRVSGMSDCMSGQVSDDPLKNSEKKDEGEGVAKTGGGVEGMEPVDGKKDGSKKGGSGKKKEGGKGVRPNGQGEQPRKPHRKKTAPVKPRAEGEGEESGKAGAKRKRKPEGDAVDGGRGEEQGQGQGDKMEGAEAGSVKVSERVGSSRLDTRLSFIFIYNLHRLYRA